MTSTLAIVKSNFKLIIVVPQFVDKKILLSVGRCDAQEWPDSETGTIFKEYS